MKIKEGLDVHTDDFWYNLTEGGYLKPEELLEDSKDVERVKEAIAVINEFEQSCEDQIEDLYI